MGLDGGKSEFDAFDAAIVLLEKKDAKAEAEKIEAALALMKHPLHFAYHVGHDLLVNRVDIFHEVDAAVTAYKGAQWEVFGQNVGAALNKLIVGTPTEMLVALPPAEAKNVEEVLAGVMEGFGLSVEKECLDGGKSEFDAFDAAIVLLEKKDVEDMKKGIQQLATAAQE